MATRNIPKQVKKTSPEIASIASLDGMNVHERELFYSVVRGSISTMNEHTPIGQVVVKQQLFRSFTKSSIELGMIFVQEYRKLVNAGELMNIDNG